mgnify:FL=1
MSALDLDALRCEVEALQAERNTARVEAGRLRESLRVMTREHDALITRLRAAEARTAELRAGLERVVKRCAEGGEQALAEAQCALDWDDDTHKEAPHV